MQLWVNPICTQHQHTAFTAGGKVVFVSFYILLQIKYTFLPLLQPGNMARA